VLAIAHASRFLRIGRFPDERIGMWYIFFQPSAVEEIAPGSLCFGRRVSPGLRVIHRYTPPVPEGKRVPRPLREPVYLAFSDVAARDRVWADLLADRT
jgi:hypothetical protein